MANKCYEDGGQPFGNDRLYELLRESKYRDPKLKHFSIAADAISCYVLGYYPRCAYLDCDVKVTGDLNKLDNSYGVFVHTDDKYTLRPLHDCTAVFDDAIQQEYQDFFLRYDSVFHKSTTTSAGMKHWSAFDLCNELSIFSKSDNEFEHVKDKGFQTMIRKYTENIGTVVTCNSELLQSFLVDMSDPKHRKYIESEILKGQ